MLHIGQKAYFDKPYIAGTSALTHSVDVVVRSPGSGPPNCAQVELTPKRSRIGILNVRRAIVI